ncbi:MAG: hypothetical protein II375_02050 [Bacteroidales bacterium]|nr:hypothetical protein [Bacteroidales bacterium]
MHYQDKRAASAVRAAIRISFALLGILCVLAIMGDMFGGLGCTILISALVADCALAMMGGFCEVAISADESFVDITCQQVLSGGGKAKVYSIEASRLVKWRHVRILFIHFLYIDYVGHYGHPKKACIGLTLVPKKTRDKLFALLEKISLNNATNRQ